MSQIASQDCCLRSNPGLELGNAFGVYVSTRFPGLLLTLQPRAGIRERLRRYVSTLLSQQREHAAGVPEEHSISLFESSLAAVR